jgi:hypothetical protein
MMCMDTVLSTLIPRPAYGSASGAIRREKKGEPVYLQYHQVFSSILSRYFTIAHGFCNGYFSMNEHFDSR